MRRLQQVIRLALFVACALLAAAAVLEAAAAGESWRAVEASSGHPTRDYSCQNPGPQYIHVHIRPYPTSLHLYPPCQTYPMEAKFLELFMAEQQHHRAVDALLHIHIVWRVKTCSALTSKAYTHKQDSTDLLHASAAEPQVQIPESASAQQGRGGDSFGEQMVDVSQGSRKQA